MSTDTAKENVSIVDSSVSQKHDVGNMEEPGTFPETFLPFLLDSSCIVLLNTRIFVAG